MASKRFSDMTEAEIRELVGGEEGEAALINDIADLIADMFGRSVIEADRELANSILRRVKYGPPRQYRDPTYGWKLDERA